jgi:hypothetical protein
MAGIPDLAQHGDTGRNPTLIVVLYQVESETARTAMLMNTPTAYPVEQHGGQTEVCPNPTALATIWRVTLS